jgi:hypothetical protein
MGLLGSTAGVALLLWARGQVGGSAQWQQRPPWRSGSTASRTGIMWEMASLFEQIGTVQEHRKGGLYARLWAHQSGGFLGEEVDEAEVAAAPGRGERGGRARAEALETLTVRHHTRSCRPASSIAPSHP